MKEIDFCHKGKILRGNIESSRGILAAYARRSLRSKIIAAKNQFIMAKNVFAQHCRDCDPCQEMFDLVEERRHALRVQAIEENKVARFPVTVTKVGVDNA